MPAVLIPVVVLALAALVVLAVVCCVPQEHLVRLWDKFVDHVAAQYRAEQTARRLLRQTLGTDEYKRLEERGYLEVPSPSTPGRVYLSDVYIVTDNGRYIGPGHMDAFEETPLELIETMFRQPNFVMHVEGTGQLTDYEVASRLSYQFWDSMPDQALFDDLAAEEHADTEDALARATTDRGREAGRAGQKALRIRTGCRRRKAVCNHLRGVLRRVGLRPLSATLARGHRRTPRLDLAATCSGAGWRSDSRR